MSKQEPHHNTKTVKEPAREMDVIAIRFDAATMAAIRKLSRTDEMLPKKVTQRPSGTDLCKPSFARTVRVLVAEALAIREAMANTTAKPPMTFTFPTEPCDAAPRPDA